MLNDTQNQHLPSPLLQAKEISHNFDYPLFKNINLCINPGESIAIIGASGTGKSTLLNIFSSLLKPNSGTVNYRNQDLYTLSNNDLLSIRRLSFGIIFQAHYLFRGFNAQENLHIAQLLCDETSIDEVLLKQLGIDHVMNQGVGELSGGQQQRLSIARILSKQPKVIFADEPTGNLDKQTADEVMDVLFNFVQKNQSCMLLVTHEEELAFACDKVYKLENMELIQLK
ncbi:MAG: ABC transporter ATP-binding protein [Campylobacterota bacterium]|nr:ABC transporter ATP-binding protein [Campylobacterota bacterium]